MHLYGKNIQNFKQLLLWSLWANFAQISYGASLGWENEKLLKWSRSVDQDGRHTHIWKKSLKIFSSRTENALGLNLCRNHWGREIYQHWKKNCRTLTFDFFTARSSLLPYAFEWEKPLKIFFSKTEHAFFL